jgi:hypothetical protein
MFMYVDFLVFVLILVFSAYQWFSFEFSDRLSHMASTNAIYEYQQFFGDDWYRIK